MSTYEEHQRAKAHHQASALQAYVSSSFESEHANDTAKHSRRSRSYTDSLKRILIHHGLTISRRSVIGKSHAHSHTQIYTLTSVGLENIYSPSSLTSLPRPLRNASAKYGFILPTHTSSRPLLRPPTPKPTCTCGTKIILSDCPV